MDLAPHLVFVVNTDWFFLSHRLPVARAALDAGMRVTLVAPDCGHAHRVRAAGVDFEHLPLDRGGVDPRRDARTLLNLTRIYRRLRPDLVHHVTPKGVIYGSLAARAAGLPRVVNAVSGLGVAFGGERPALARLVAGLYRAALSHPGGRTIFQNPDDRDLFVSARLVRGASTVLIRGSGVDLARFSPRPEPSGPVTVAFASRLLRDKGVDDFVAMVRELRGRLADARFVLVGAPDPDNPTSVSEDQVRRWTEELGVEWWGHRADMHEVFAQVHLVVLPTRYREGLPKVLAEAAASGRAIVTTDVPGCREVVQHGVNGLCVPPGDGAALARAVSRLTQDHATRREMGARGRDLAERGLSLGAVVEQHMALYRELLAGPGAVGPPRPGFVPRI